MRYAGYQVGYIGWGRWNDCVSIQLNIKILISMINIRYRLMLCKLKPAQIFSFRVFHPIFAAVDFIHCNCNDSDIMGCCQRLDFATVNAYMVKKHVSCLFKSHIQNLSEKV